MYVKDYLINLRTNMIQKFRIVCHKHLFGIGEIYRLTRNNKVEVRRRRNTEWAKISNIYPVRIDLQRKEREWSGGRDF